jgi:uncharacterized protein YndB with AHSA1/START domain
MTSAPDHFARKKVDDGPIVLDYDLDAAPEALWRALTDPALVASWLAPNDLSPHESTADMGQRFLLQPSPGESVACEVLVSEPARRLCYRWREIPDGGQPLDSVVTFEITPGPDGGSHLRLVHRKREGVGANGLVGALGGLLRRGANDNGKFKGWSLAWAA